MAIYAPHASNRNYQTMEELPETLKEEIEALDSLGARALRRRYASSSLNTPSGLIMNPKRLSYLQAGWKFLDLQPSAPASPSPPTKSPLSSPPPSPTNRGTFAALSAIRVTSAANFHTHVRVVSAPCRARNAPMRVNHAPLRVPDAPLRVVLIRDSRHFCRDGDRLPMAANRKCGEKYKRKWKWSMK